MNSKYRSKKITVDGETFDSKKEYKRWKELRMLEKAGKIYGLRRQVKYRLLPSQYIEEHGKRVCVERPVSYIADFVYSLPGGEMAVEDCKGFRTKDYILKRKMMLYLNGIRVREV